MRAFGKLRLACRAFAPLALAATAGGLVLSGCASSLNHSSGIIMNRDIVDRFPGATLLGEVEFASAVVGQAFRYREVGSEPVLVMPKEVFVEGGQYRIHGIRTISYGTWAIARGIVSIDCTDCQYAFIGLGRERVFFRHQDRLLMATANGEGIVVELIPEP